MVPATTPNLTLPLRAACIHGRYETHDDYDDGVRIWPGCPGGRNTTIEEALDKIRSALSGEAEPLKKLVSELAAAIGDGDDDRRLSMTDDDFLGRDDSDIGVIDE